jgi:hypothetical protein
LISSDETNKRISLHYNQDNNNNNNNYILTIKEIVDNDYIIVTNVDATSYGGIARFVNHRY